MALNTTTGSGTQSATGSPQSVGTPINNSTLSGNVQPGTATNLLNSSGGISLSGSRLTTVELGGTSSTTQTSATAPVESSQINTVALGVSITLAVIAAVVFVVMTRSAKNTTQ